MAPRRSGQQNRHRSTLSLQKTEITIHVYDLLPPGRLSSVLWTVGASLLHSGVVINNKEYAYGGHDRPGLTGVYWTRPKTDPPGGTFKSELLHGFTLATEEEITSALQDISEEFQGTKYNLLTRNCNHFTSALCERLTGTPAPGWLNRAASIGVAMPCMVPRNWVEPPEYDTADGALLDDVDGVDDGRDDANRSGALSPLRVVNDEDEDSSDWDSEGDGPPVKKSNQDTAGRTLPAAERAPRS